MDGVKFYMLLLRRCLLFFSPFGFSVVIMICHSVMVLSLGIF